MKPYMCSLQVGDTVLHTAARKGHQDVLQLLIDAGMVVNIKGSVSWYKHIYICNMLMHSVLTTNNDVIKMCGLYMYWVTIVHGEVTL